MRRHSDTLRGANATTKEEVHGEKTTERASCEVRVLSSRRSQKEVPEEKTFEQA